MANGPMARSLPLQVLGVANPDSNSVSVIDAATGTVSVLDTASDAVVGDIQLGSFGSQSGDGFDPAGIVLAITPTPGS
jgi:DNA-binding beta-propeller fold protein YncE